MPSCHERQRRGRATGCVDVSAGHESENLLLALEFLRTFLTHQRWGALFCASDLITAPNMYICDTAHCLSDDGTSITSINKRLCDVRKCLVASV